MGVWLITGASRGFGRALTDALLAKGETVVAAVRNPATLQDLNGTKAIVAKWDASDNEDSKALIQVLQTEHGITKLDVVIANAGFAGDQSRVEDMTPEDFRNGFQINTLAPVLLFQAALPLLEDGSKFVYITSGAGTIGLIDKIPFPMGSYGPSKAAANFFFRKLHFEHPNLVIFPVHPGTVATDMGRESAERLHRDPSVLVPLEQASVRLLALIEGATRESHGGKFNDSWAEELGPGVREWPW